MKLTLLKDRTMIIILIFCQLIAPSRPWAMRSLRKSATHSFTHNNQVRYSKLKDSPAETIVGNDFYLRIESKNTSIKRISKWFIIYYNTYRFDCFIRRSTWRKGTSRLRIRLRCWLMDCWRIYRSHPVVVVKAWHSMVSFFPTFHDYENDV